MCECCKNKINIDEMTNYFLTSSIKVIVEKECGYSFLIYLNEFSTMIDLYRYVEQFYQHVDENKILYKDKDRKEIIYKTEIRIKDFIDINIKKFKSDINIKKFKSDVNSKDSYTFYLNFL